MKYALYLGLFAMLILASGPVAAQDTLALYADFGEEDDGALSRALITKPGVPFDVVAVAKTDAGLTYIEFSMTELSMLYPGVFKYTTLLLGTDRPNFGDADLGEYAFGSGIHCTPGGEVELMRVRYHDVSGSLPENVVLELRNMESRGDLRLYAFDGSMGYVDCANTNHILTPEEWDDDAMDPTRIDGVVDADGILVINPAGLTVRSTESTVSTLKSRF